MLHCEFPLGRPLGMPGDAAFQERVLLAAFGLLPRTDVPVLVDFPETVEDRSDEPLACALPLRQDPNAHPAVDEALGLRAAYERQRSAKGTTNVSRLGGAERIAELVGVFVRIVDGAPWDQVGLDASQIGQAALDIRAYYEEAALALVDHVPGARQAEAWIYQTTQTGAILRQAQRIMREADAPRPAWFGLMPVGH